MRFKNLQRRESCGKGSDTRRSKHTCIVEAHESARKRLERTLPKDHEDRIVRKVHKFFPMPRAMKVPDAKAAVDEEWGNSRKLASMADDQSKKLKDGHHRVDLCHLKNSELEPKFQTYEGRVVLRGEIVQDDSGSYAVFTEQGSSGCHSKGYQNVQDRQPTHCQLTPKSKWKTLQH